MVAAEEAMLALSIAPTRRPRNWLPARATSTWRVSSLSASGASPSFITFMPRKMKPKPSTTWPRLLSSPRREKKVSAKPAPTSRSDSSWTRNASSCTVTVVPMSAPRIIPSDWGKVRRPADTKPISMRVVADEDWMIAVTSAPEATAARRVLRHAGEQVAQVTARRPLQPLADELHAVEQQGETAEERQQRHVRG